jgi:hypothetical protein
MIVVILLELTKVAVYLTRLFIIQATGKGRDENAT